MRARRSAFPRELAVLKDRSMSTDHHLLIERDPKGLRHFGTGAIFGIAGGVVGLVLPVSVNLLVLYAAVGILSFDTTLIALTGILVLAGAVLLAISLILYRLGFSALRKFDRRFLVASVLCNIGTVGLVLIVASAAIALVSTPALAACVRNSPAHALSCLGSVQPLTTYSVIVGFWLAWLGGLGIVVGLVWSGRRYRDARLVAGGAVYALLLLVLIDPFVALLLPIGGWQYPLLTIPVLALAAPACVFSGSRRIPRSRSLRWT
jgi:hypothetical protein